MDAELEMQAQKVEVEEVQKTQKRVDPTTSEKGLHLEIPESIYGAAMILPMIENIGNSTRQRFMITLQLFIAVATNVYVQAYMVYKVYDMYKQKEEDMGECAGYIENLFNLRLLCITIYAGYVMADLSETLKMGLFVYNFQTAQTWEYLEYVIEEDEVTGEGEREFATGMTKPYKAFCYICLIFPKFCVAMSLLTYGTGYVVNSDAGEDLVLNALALGFVLEIDEMFYNYFLTVQMQDVLADVPAVVIPDTCSSNINKELGMFFKVIALGALTAGAYAKFCPEDI